MKINQKIKHEKVPHFVQIETSYHCNARCAFCYNPCRNNPIDVETIRKVINSIAASHIPQVQLTGGEVSTLPPKVLNEFIDTLSQNSSVTIQTNAHQYIPHLSKNLAAIYVSLHGTKKYHEELQKPAKWEDIVANIKKYIADGFEVNCDFTLTSTNFDNYEEIALMASSWGVHQYSVNKFEPAGLGVANFAKLMPTVEQFRILLDQMIRVQSKTKMLVGFCTAIPYCLDLRMAEYGLLSNCGAGVSFLSVSPNGDVRICNQSPVSYGNVLQDNIVTIQNNRKISEFRNKSWVTQPCADCFLFDLCLAGCKVDNSIGQKYCVDYAVRDLKKCPVKPKDFYQKVAAYKAKRDRAWEESPLKDGDVFALDRFTKIYHQSRNHILVTRYQSIKLDRDSAELVDIIINHPKYTDMVQKVLQSGFEPSELDKFLRSLIHLDAVRRIQND